MCVTQCQAGQTLVGTFCQVVANKSTPVYVIGLIIAIAIIVAALMAICIAIKRSKVKKQKAKKTQKETNVDTDYYAKTVERG